MDENKDDYDGYFFILILKDIVFKITNGHRLHCDELDRFMDGIYFKK